MSLPCLDVGVPDRAVRSLLPLCAVCLLVVGLAGCAVGSIQDYSEDAAAPPTQAQSECDALVTEFTETVWAPILRPVCLNCHVVGGLAASQNADFVLEGTDQPDYLKHNLLRLVAFAAKTEGGVPVLLLKPSGRSSTPHAGGAPLPTTSPEYTTLRDFLTQASGAAAACQSTTGGNNNNGGDNGDVPDEGDGNGGSDGGDNGGPGGGDGGGGGNNDDGGDPGNGGGAGNGGGECTPLVAYFEQNVWTPIISKLCLGCHLEGGMAAGRGARFVLKLTSQPGGLEANLAAARAMVEATANGVPLLLAKPSNQVSHGGGERFSQQSSQYAALQAFVQRLATPQPCDQ